MAAANFPPSPSPSSSSSCIYVKVDKSMQILDSITPTTTVGDVILRLANKCRLTKPQVLLEVWNGCSRLFQSDELLLESLNKWGQQKRTVTLVMMDRDKYVNGITLGLEVSKRKERRRRRKRRDTVCIIKACPYKLSYKRLPIRCTYRQRHLFKREQLSKLKRDIERYKEDRERLNNNMSMSNNAANYRGEQDIISRLDPSMQTRYYSLSSDIGKTVQSNNELLKHKKELTQTITNRQHEITALQQAIDTKQKQLKYEKQTFKREELLEDSTISNLESSYEDLLINLKAKLKIAQLQSMKLQELSSIKGDIERQLSDCIEQIQTIKIPI